MIRERLDTFEDDERAKGIEILLHRAEGVARYANLFQMVMETLSELAQTPNAPKKKMTETVEGVLHYRGKELPEEMRAAWLRLRGMLVGTDFHSRMERYVAMDILEDKFDEEGQHVDKAEPEITKPSVDTSKPAIRGRGNPGHSGERSSECVVARWVGASKPRFSGVLQ